MFIYFVYVKLTMIQKILQYLRYKLNQFIIENDYYKACARCEDCGRLVKDFIVDTDLWIAVYGGEGGVLCYTCFRWRLTKLDSPITVFKCKGVK